MPQRRFLVALAKGGAVRASLPAACRIRPVGPGDDEDLAILVMDADAGTIDADGSETIETARSAVAS